MGLLLSEAQIEGFGLPVWHSPNPFTQTACAWGGFMKKK
jgi:hypothetical protein